MRRAIGGLATMLLLPLAACSEEDPAGGETLTVFAAASLTAVLEELEQRFEDEHPGVDVRLSFGGSSDLVAQLTDGAEADVLATADTTNMDRLVDAGLAATEPAEIATNTLVIAVPPGNPAGVTGLSDLGREDLALVLCAPEVPCGRAAQQVADEAGVDLRPDSEEQSVSDVLGKIEAGEGDAGLVYVSDVQGAGGAVDGVDLPEAAGVVNHYPVVRVEGSAEPGLADEWIALLLGDGQAVLREAGFGPPDPSSDP